MNNGDIIAVKIISVSSTEIRYNRFDKPNGPDYIMDPSDAKKVKRADGSFYDLRAPQKEKPAPVAAKTETIAPSASKFIPIDKKKYTHDGAIAKENRMYKIMALDNDPVLNLMVKKSKKARTLQYLSFVAIPLGLGALESYAQYLLHINTDVLNGFGSANNSKISCFLYSGATAAVTITGFCFKARHKKMKRMAIDHYNSKR